MSEPVDLDGIEARANAATPGPWHGPHEDGLGCVHIGDYGWVAGAVDGETYRYPHDGEDSEEGKADAEFIAHARADVPALVAEVRALREDADLHREGYEHDLAEIETLRRSLAAAQDDILRLRRQLGERVS